VAAGKIDRGATLTSLRRRLGRDPEARKRALAKLVQSRTKGPRRAPLSAEYVLAAALRPMLTGGLAPTLRPRRSGPRLPGLPRL